ncbi:MAG: phage terminase large subunit, partial [Pseudomonadota bacterium]
LVTIPPRHLKSVCASVALPAWLMGHEPAIKLLVASYSDDLAAKHARDFRMIVEADWYRELFPHMRRKGRKNTETDFENSAGGQRKAVSLAGGVTGFGADILIIDDLMKAQAAASEPERKRVKDYYEQTLYSRLNDKSTGRIIAIQQRLCEDDLAGHLIEKGGFEHLTLPSIAQENQTIDLYAGRTHVRKTGDLLFEANEPQEVLDDIRREIGNYAFSAQYLQNPTPIDGARVKWDKIETYTGVADPKRYQFVAQSWDTGLTAEASSDYSVCITWGFREGIWDLIDVYRAKLDYGDLKSRVIAMREKFGAGIVIMENAGTGKLLIREFRNDSLGRLESFTPRGDKETRFEAQLAKLESGKYRLPEDAIFMADFKRELSSFPNGKYDDQVDATSQFLQWSGSRRGRANVDVDPVTGRRRRRSIRPRKAKK